MTCRTFSILLITLPLLAQCNSPEQKQKETSGEAVKNTAAEKGSEKKPASQPAQRDTNLIGNKKNKEAGNAPFTYHFSNNTIHKYQFTQKTAIQQFVRGEKGFGRNIDGTGEILINPLSNAQSQVKLTQANGTMIRNHPGRKPTDTVDISMNDMMFGPMNARGVLDSKKGYMALLFKLIAPLPDEKLHPGDSAKITKGIDHQVRMTSNVHAQDFTTSGYKTIKRAPDTTVNGKNCLKFIQRYHFDRPEQAASKTFKGTIDGKGILIVDQEQQFPLQGRMNVKVTLQRDAHHAPQQNNDKKGKVLLETDTYYTLSRF